MQIPLEIAFRKVAKPDWVEGAVRARVQKLSKLYQGLTGCRVHVEQRADTPESKTPPVVHIEMSVPGRRDLVVAYEPERLQLRYKRPDLYHAISHAFTTAERMIVEHKRQLEGRTKIAHHDVQNQFLGQVVDIFTADDHGFLLTKEGGTLYFHRNSLLYGDFDNLKPGDAVHYVEEMGDTGPIATKVRPVNNSKS
jgi:cold shock CspA family protein/ribosome-associated translation inhibitor RaiA